MKITELKQLVKDILKEELDNLDNEEEMEETDPLEAELDVDLGDEEEEVEDEYYKSDEDDASSMEDEVEPTTISKSDSILDKNKEKLLQLQSQKDELVSKFKNKEITMDQYKSMIGNIPAQIKDLRAKIDGQEEMDETIELRESFQKRMQKIAGIITE